jgi:hypothetical protein
MNLDQKGLKKRSITVAYFFNTIGKKHDIKFRRLNDVMNRNGGFLSVTFIVRGLLWRALPICLPINGYRLSEIPKRGI